MIGRMIRYEFKATWKFMCIVFLCVCFISVGIYTAVELNEDAVVPMKDDAGNILDYVSEAWAYGVVGAMFLLMASIVIIVCFGIIRFKKVLTSEEGYLVNTLPVGTGSIILSKTVTFFAYAIPVVVVAFIVFFNLLLNSEGGIPAGRLVGELAIANAFNPTGEQIAKFVVSSVQSLVLGCSALFQLYAAMAIGFSFSRHKKLWSFWAFLAIVFGIDVMTEVFTPIRNYIYHYVPMQYEDIVGLIIQIIVAVIFFFITYYFMKKRTCIE